MATTVNGYRGTSRIQLMRKAFRVAAGFCSFLFAVTISTSYAQPPAQSCTQSLKTTKTEPQQAQSRFSACRSAKLNELENFNAKRARYRRLMAWANQLQFSESLQPYKNALAERDLLLTSKADSFESCVPPLRDISVGPNSSSDDTLCDKTLTSAKSELAAAANDLKTCQSCSLATIGEGYNKSALEILVAQQKDARTLRENLYQQLLAKKVGMLSTANQWQITRDVFLAYITDTAIQLANTQPLIVMLEHLEKTLESVDAPGDKTNKVMDVYRQLANTLQDKPENRHQNAIHLWELFNGVVPRHHATTDMVRHSGFNDADEIVQLVNTMSAPDRQILVSAITSALARYKLTNS